jgi:hypothetical protein
MRDLDNVASMRGFFQREPASWRFSSNSARDPGDSGTNVSTCTKADLVIANEGDYVHSIGGRHSQS